MIFSKKFTPEAVYQIQKLSPQVKRALRALTDQLAAHPFLGKPLQGDLEGFWSVRHQRYRVVYEIDEKYRRIIIAYLGKRENVYTQFEKLIALQRSKPH